VPEVFIKSPGEAIMMTEAGPKYGQNMAMKTSQTLTFIDVYVGAVNSYTVMARCGRSKGGIVAEQADFTRREK
jgi:hypothetical protein